MTRTTDRIAAIEAARREDDDFTANLAAQRGGPVETTIPFRGARTSRRTLAVPIEALIAEQD